MALEIVNQPLSSLWNISPKNTVNLHHFLFNRGFPGSSACKEFACNAGDPGSISGLGRSPGEWKTTHSVAQTVKNPSAMWETWVQSLGWEDPLEEGMATYSSILAWRIPGVKIFISFVVSWGREWEYLNFDHNFNKICSFKNYHV